VDGLAGVLQVGVKREGEDLLFVHFGGIRLVRSRNYEAFRYFMWVSISVLL